MEFHLLCKMSDGGSGLLSFRRHLRTLSASGSITLGSATIGSILGYSSLAVADINDPRNHHRTPFHLNDADILWLTSSVSIGLLVGGLIGGFFLVDRLGRKTTAIYAGVPCVIGWVLVAVSPNIAFMLFGRILGGLSAGVFSVSVVIYNTEIAEPSVRGLVSSLNQLLFNVGLLYVYAFALVIHWNWLAVVCALLPCFMTLLMMLFPESPRWLLAQGRRNAAQEALEWFRGKDVDVSVEMAGMETAIKQSLTDVFRWSEFCRPSFYKRLLIVMGLLSLMEFSGYAAITEYTVSIMVSFGASWDPNIQAAVVGVVGLLANSISAFTVDRFGRRVMLLVSSLGMTVGMCGLSLFFTLLSDTGHTWLPTSAVLLFIFFASLGYCPIPFYLASELFPLRSRGVGSGVSMATLNLSTFLMTFSFPYLLDALDHHGVYWMFTALCLVAAAFVAVVPETKGKTLEEIERMF